MKLQAVTAKCGALRGARVIDLETGEEVENLVSISYAHDAHLIPTLTIVVRAAEYELIVNRKEDDES